VYLKRLHKLWGELYAAKQSGCIYVYTIFGVSYTQQNNTQSLMHVGQQKLPFRAPERMWIMARHRIVALSSEVSASASTITDVKVEEEPLRGPHAQLI
jgi:hypothetical protein